MEVKMDDWMIEQLEQEKKDAELLNNVKNSSTDANFKQILFEIEESEHPSNFRLVDEPIGEPQDEVDYIIWIVQSSGETGDNYSGTVCMELSTGKYLMWNYWM